jgi:peptidoglycan/LPS O-acetylase OafA/YrhL
MRVPQAGWGNRMRFYTLDGLRGVAAILVLFYHLGGSVPIAAPAGYLAVDLFFGLSGFVLSHAYEDRLKSGLTLQDFAIRRFVRIYPMAFVGAAVGVLLSGRFLPSLLLIPDFGGLGALYPANVPMWSLVLELIVNLIFAAVAVRIGRHGLALILASSAAILAFGSSIYGAGALGPFWSTASYGLARTVFSFSLGVGIRRLHAAWEIRGRETPLAWLPPAALFVLLTQLPGHHFGWEMACIFLMFPTLLWLGAIWEAPHARSLRFLGELSYPLYCIQGALIQAFNGTVGAPPYLWAVLIVVAWWLGSRVDRPVREWLSRRRPRARSFVA